MRHLAFGLLGFLLTGFSVQAATERRISRNSYIETWSAEAQRQMTEYGIPASITLAQGILESGDGNSALARYANNHFGIKCHEGWNGETYIQDDDTRDECFRKYSSASESYRDHSEFLKTRSRYASLFTLSPTDYKGWAQGLKKAGYATNPQYANLLIRLIEAHNLHQYDTPEALATVSPAKKESKTEEAYTATLQLKHEVRQHEENKLRYIVVKEGDTFYKIAKEFELGLWQVYKYNDLSKKDVLQEGDILYLEPKRNRSKKTELHRVKEGETLYAISQHYGIKLRKLCRLNNIEPGTGEPEPGTQLHLRKRKKV